MNSRMSSATRSSWVTSVQAAGALPGMRRQIGEPCQPGVQHADIGAVAPQLRAEPAQDSADLVHPVPRTASVEVGGLDVGARADTSARITGDR